MAEIKPTKNASERPIAIQWWTLYVFLERSRRGKISGVHLLSKGHGLTIMICVDAFHQSF